MHKKLLLSAFCMSLCAGNASALTFYDPLAPVNLDSFVGGSFDGHDALAFSVNQSNGALGVANAFVHYFTFDIGNPLSNLISSGFETPVIFGTTQFTKIDALTVQFYNMGADNGINGGDDSLIGGASVNTNVIAGHYYMKVSGKTGGFPPYIGGVYSGAISVTPVPEPETWAMLVAGLGLVGLQLRRHARAGRISIN